MAILRPFRYRRVLPLGVMQALTLVFGNWAPASEEREGNDTHGRGIFYSEGFPSTVRDFIL